MIDSYENETCDYDLLRLLGCEDECTGVRGAI